MSKTKFCSCKTLVGILQHIWAYLEEDIDNLEWVQRRAAEAIRGLKTKSFEDYFKKLGMFHLEKINRRSDSCCQVTEGCCTAEGVNFVL